MMGLNNYVINEILGDSLAQSHAALTCHHKHFIPSHKASNTTVLADQNHLDDKMSLILKEFMLAAPYLKKYSHTTESGQSFGTPANQERRQQHVQKTETVTTIMLFLHVQAGTYFIIVSSLSVTVLLTSLSFRLFT